MIPRFTMIPRRNTRKAKICRNVIIMGKTTICTPFDNINEPINSQCPITMSEFQNGENVLIIRQCRHIFNAVALKDWILTHSLKYDTDPTCPLCRCILSWETQNDDINDLLLNNTLDVYTFI